MILRRIVPRALLLLALAGCGDDDDSPTAPARVGEPVALEVTPGSLTLNAVGDSVRFTAVARDSDANEIADARVVWTNPDPAVATVSADGWVVARGNGTAGVVANVRRAGELAVAAAADSNGVAIGNVAVEWASIDDAIATVDSTGLVTAMWRST